MRHGKRLAVLAVAGVLLMAVSGAGQPADKPGEKGDPKLPTKKEIMAAKLKHTQDILAGVALSDPNKVADSAAELLRVSKAAAFLDAYKGDEYKFQTTTFRRAAEAVEAKAKDKNMDGVMVAYNDLTLSCVKCHQAMRDKKFDAARPTPGDPRGE